MLAKTSLQDSLLRGTLGATGPLRFLESLLSSWQSPRPWSRPGQRRREKVSLPTPRLGGTSLFRLLSIPGKDDERVLTEGGKRERRFEAQTVEELNLSVTLAAGAGV